MNRSKSILLAAGLTLALALILSCSSDGGGGGSSSVFRNSDFSFVASPIPEGEFAIIDNIWFEGDFTPGGTVSYFVESSEQLSELYLQAGNENGYYVRILTRSDLYSNENGIYVYKIDLQVSEGLSEGQMQISTSVKTEDESVSRVKRKPVEVTRGGSSSSGGGGGSGCAIQGYKTVKIGTQTWMAENLNCDVSGSVCYDNDPANCVKYGRLYDWETAMSVCPSGWHLPSDADWDKLMTAVGGSSNAGTKLKAKTGWNNSGNGTDEHGFSALPGGYGGSDGNFYGAGGYGSWWSSSEDGSGGAYSRNMYYYDEYASRNYDGKTSLFSVRCVQD